VAAYLRGDAEQSARTDRVLDRLTRGTDVPGPEVSVAKPEETVNHSLLESLVSEQSSPPKEAPGGEKSLPSTPADLREADEKLSSLLRKPKS
jgi:hypothetical protein